MNMRRLEVRLAELNLSKKQLAEMMGITPQAINAWIQYNRCSLRNMQKLVSILKVSESYFMDDDPANQACDPPVQYYRDNELVKDLLIQKDKYIERLEKDIEKLEVECAELRALKKEAK